MNESLSLFYVVYIISAIVSPIKKWLRILWIPVMELYITRYMEKYINNVIISSYDIVISCILNIFVLKFGDSEENIYFKNLKYTSQNVFQFFLIILSSIGLYEPFRIGPCFWNNIFSSFVGAWDPESSILCCGGTLCINFICSSSSFWNIK